MRTTAIALVLCVVSPAFADCPRDEPEVTQLVAEGDKLRSLDVDGALAKYEAARTMAPRNHHILWKIATTYQKKEQWDRVASTLRAALDIAPTYANYAWLRGYALKQLWMKGSAPVDDARAELEQAIKIDPKLADAHFDLAEIYARTHQEQRALEHFTTAIELKPSEGPFYAALADLYIRLDYPDHAEKTAREGLSFSTKDADRFVLFSLAGSVRSNKNDAAGAISDFENAAKACGPCNERGQQLAYFNLGAAYAQAKRSREAIEKLQQFFKRACKGAAAQRYADECVQAQEIVRQTGTIP